MARSHRICLSEVIDCLDNEEFDDLMAPGSDDDLGMDVDYDLYDSDNPLEGIINFYSIKVS